MGKKKEKRERIAAELAQEIEDWEIYLLMDLQERIKKNGGKPLSERQLKKTTNGNATYERMVRVIGRGSPERLRQVMTRMAYKPRGMREGDKRFEEAKSFEKTEHFESENHFEESGRFESAEHFEEFETRTDETSREVSQLAEKPERKKWDKESLLVFLRGKCRELGRAPKSVEVAEWSKKKLCPSYPTCMKLLEVNTKVELDELLLGKECA